VNGRRLARVQRVRELQERVLRAEWAAAERAAAEAQDTVHRLGALRGAAEADLARTMGAARLDARNVMLDQDSVARIDRAVVAAAASAQEARRHAERMRAPWQERRSDAEALARLGARLATVERQAEAKAEQGRLDEHSGARHAARRAELVELDEHDKARRTGEDER
jgi:flagellar export protein FliJ